MSRLEASGGPVGAAGLPAIVEQTRAAAEGGAVERERAAVEALPPVLVPRVPRRGERRSRRAHEVGDPGWGAHRPGRLRLADPAAPGPDAEFVFVDDPAEVPAEVTAFDMRGAELGHHGGDCGFETVLRRHHFDDPVLWKLAELVHEADLDDERFDAPEARGLDVVLRGLSMIADDPRVLEISGPLFEYHRCAMLLGREPA